METETNLKCRTDHATPLYPQKLALNSPTSGGRLVGIVCSRTKATELVSFETSCAQVKLFLCVINKERAVKMYGEMEVYFRRS
jgi:hypothetical protein